jgi:hypothetical protein
LGQAVSGASLKALQNATKRFEAHIDKGRPQLSHHTRGAHLAKESP